MKKILLIVFLLSTAFGGKGQNLVPNWSFEQYTTCPTDWGQVDSVLFWNIPTNGTTDYFNQCATNPFWAVPDNIYGYQPAHSGNAYCGMVGYGLSDWREYVEVELTNSLVANQCYHLECYINLADESGYTSDALGAYFSNVLIDGILNSDPLPFIPQINFNLGLSTDTVNWILLSGDFTAAGGENHLIIGNYKYDAQTNSLPLPGGSYQYSFFLIDDVSLTPCTGIEEQSDNEAINIFPNPVKDKLYVQSSKFKTVEIAEIKIYDILGKEIYRDEIKTSNIKLQTSNYLSGIYFIEINTGTETYRKKFRKE